MNPIIVTINPIVFGIAIAVLICFQVLNVYFGYRIGRILESRKTNKALRKIDKLQGELADLQDFRNRACETYKNEPN